jgi:ketosteroid isomerase-like protein
MSHEEADPLALTRALSAADIETTMGYYAPDAVWDGSPLGLEIYEGRDAIRKSLEEWMAIFGGHEEVDVELLDLGHGVVLTATRLSGHQRSAGSAGEVHGVYGYVHVWDGGKLTRLVVYPDIDEARAAARRLAEERA